MIICLGLAVLLSTVGQAVWWESKPEILSHLEPLDQVLSRWDLSSEFVWDQLNRCISFLAWSSFAHGMLVLALLLVTIPFSSALGWVLRITGLTLLDGAYVLSGLQLAKVKFAHGIEGRAKDLGRLAFGPWWSGLHAEFRLWRSWSCFRGFGSLAARSCSVILHVLHYMRYHLLWPRFLDDKAAVCNGLRIWAKCKLFPERNLCRSS